MDWSNLAMNINNLPRIVKTVMPFRHLRAVSQTVHRGATHGSQIRRTDAPSD